MFKKSPKLQNPPKKLYQKLIFLLFDGMPYEYINTNLTISQTQLDCRYHLKQFNLFTQLTTQQPQNSLLLRMNVDTAPLTSSRVISYMLGIGLPHLQWGILQNNQSEVRQEDNLLYQIKNSQNIKENYSFLNQWWYVPFPKVFQNDQYINKDHEGQANDQENEEALLKIKKLIVDDKFDMIFFHLENVDVEGHTLGIHQQNYAKQIQFVNNKTQEIINKMSNDTLFIALSDHGVAHNQDGGHYKCKQGDFVCSSFFFAYTKNGFVQRNQFLDEINNGEKLKEIDYTQIGSTISTLFGLQIPFLNSGWPLLEIYPKQMNLDGFKVRILEDNWRVLQQQIVLIKTLQNAQGKIDNYELIMHKHQQLKKNVGNLKNIIELQKEINQSINQFIQPFNIKMLNLALILSVLSLFINILIIFNKDLLLLQNQKFIQIIFDLSFFIISIGFLFYFLYNKWSLDNKEYKNEFLYFIIIIFGILTLKIIFNLLINEKNRVFVINQIKQNLFMIFSFLFFISKLIIFNYFAIIQLNALFLIFLVYFIILLIFNKQLQLILKIKNRFWFYYMILIQVYAQFLIQNYICNVFLAIIQVLLIIKKILKKNYSSNVILILILFLYLNLYLIYSLDFDETNLFLDYFLTVSLLIFIFSFFHIKNNTFIFICLYFLGQYYMNKQNIIFNEILSNFDIIKCLIWQFYLFNVNIVIPLMFNIKKEQQIQLQECQANISQQNNQSYFYNQYLKIFFKYSLGIIIDFILYQIYYLDGTINESYNVQMNNIICNYANSIFQTNMFVIISNLLIINVINFLNKKYISYNNYQQLDEEKQVK
ncbi:phosphoethanolamine n-, putative [Ichthyophthirius multifiliis]|uniref:Phosphoethanolamine n-, putative n=1 Tax=Ichthyophthirius multifiliis TaxID=5932 RepID=G0QTF1_ICHMU|nr:phosphoethanolamine n-, putative [Ichthyophthirius multifiliis]EGR31528.1 phosphoethanolamine n-, putative [Ichthyophthirius multifiliis]|eukprot:XP_004035014.1 phosphoethanolamine n-, putative [Ichthyophthirius multifiliis]